MLSLLVSTLLQHLTAGTLPAAPGVRQVMLPWPDGAAAPMLDWLNAWPLYPQCYWQHRDGHEEVASCGAVRHFTRLGDAQRFLAEQPSAKALRIWGLNAFGAGEDEPQSALFLPRLSWRCLRDRYQIMMTFCSETSLAADAADFLAWLEAHGADAPVALPPLTARVTSVTHPGITRVAGVATPRRSGAGAIPPRRTGKGGAGPALRAARGYASFAAGADGGQPAGKHRCFHYLMAWSPHEAFLGSSPERLYHRDDRRLNTEALAGTVACDPDPRQAAEQAAWLMADEKNQRENLVSAPWRTS
ncbi:MAG: chorismate-binding protein [Sodalis sp. (in: enterobacteria)]|uniref:chorismate-binding protein n=1 Tax=Sodalis sp. (in: enterobacteria) TaxID=1898979 RepID=UPI0039E6A303